MMNKRRLCLLLVLLAASCGFLFHAAFSPRVLSVYFIDVEQGDAAFIVFPCGKNMLIDGGERWQQNTDLVDFLRRAGARRIDAVILSHAHSDHAGGLLEVLERMDVGLLIEPGHPHTTELYINLLELALSKNIPYHNVSRGDSLGGFGEAGIVFLNPPDDFFKDESPLNNNSIVMLLSYGEIRFLFTGDIERRAEDDLARVYGERLASDVLKVPHHGSGSSSTPAFLEAVNPVLAVISSGASNRFGHPHKNVLERYKSRGVRVYRTDLDGTVLIQTDGSRLSVSTRR